MPSSHCWEECLPHIFGSNAFLTFLGAMPSSHCWEECLPQCQSLRLRNNDSLPILKITSIIHFSFRFLNVIFNIRYSLLYSISPKHLYQTCQTSIFFLFFNRIDTPATPISYKHLQELTQIIDKSSYPGE